MALKKTIALTTVPKTPNAVYVSGLNIMTAIAERKPRIIITAQMQQCFASTDAKLVAAEWYSGGASANITIDTDNPGEDIKAPVAEIARLYGLMLDEVAKINVVRTLL